MRLGTRVPLPSGTSKHLWRAGALLALTTMVLIIARASVPVVNWPMFGQNPTNNAFNIAETTISASNVGQLAPKWVVTTGGDVSARASVMNGVVYFPDWGGNLWAVGATSGSVIWSHQLSDYGLPSSTRSRTTPAVSNGILYTATQQGAYLLAINAATGALVWKTQLESVDPMAIVSSSPVVFNGVVYAGVASTAEAASLAGVTLSTSPARGSVVAVNASTGAIQWKTYTAPVGYIGAGVWGSNPVVDPFRGNVYVGTGDNYAHPANTAESALPGVNFGACLAGGLPESACLSPNDHVDSILALDMNTGAIKWSRRMVTWNQPFVTDGSDDWNVDCITGGTQCPTPAPVGPDYDFASAPNLITYIGSDHKPHTLLGAGQKSGIYFALDPSTGADLWRTQVGPGSALGGMEWGSASDGQRIYVSIANLYGIPTAKGSAGSWAALDPGTGAILWQTADPNGAIDLGPLSVANGVVYASSMAGSATAPTMFALNASTGSVLWNFAAGSSVNAGATVVNGVVYWGSGYAHLGIPGFTGNTKFYAFSQGGK